MVMAILFSVIIVVLIGVLVENPFTVGMALEQIRQE
jgi:hypothetical protein